MKNLRVVLWVISALVSGWLLSFVPNDFNFGGTIVWAVALVDIVATWVAFKDMDILKLSLKGLVWIIIATVSLLVVL